MRWRREFNRGHRVSSSLISWYRSTSGGGTAKGRGTRRTNVGLTHCARATGRASSSAQAAMKKTRSLSSFKLTQSDQLARKRIRLPPATATGGVLGALGVLAKLQCVGVRIPCWSPSGSKGYGHHAAAAEPGFGRGEGEAREVEGSFIERVVVPWQAVLPTLASSNLRHSSDVRRPKL